MDDIVVLRSVPVELTSDIGHAFVVDCVRAAEGLISDRELTEKYELDPPAWTAITKNAGFGRAVRAERERRVHNGVAAREAAARAYVRAPTILDSIMSSTDSNPRHRIEAAKEIRAVATGGGDANRPADSSRFIIRIDLSSDGHPHIETYDKALKPDAPAGDGPTNLIPLEGGKSDDQW